MKTQLPKLIPPLLALVSLNASAATRYVDLNGPSPTPPYPNWLTAATNIQDAVDVATNGDTVLVANGVYATGGRRWFDSGTNRVTLTNAVTLQSVNGPAVTLIVGNRVAGVGPALTNAVRCVGMGNGAVLSGFTLTNGESGWGNYPNGGGVARVVGSVQVTVTNCVLIANLSTNGAGGGAYRVSLINCQITVNYARLGGGASSCSLVNCTVISNTASAGGGVYGSSFYGASILSNCTIVGNSASSSGGGVDNGGIGDIKNCIVYYNTAPNGSNYAGIKMNYCCTTPTFNGDLTSFTNAPIFEDLDTADVHLQSNSPCINAGNNSYVTNPTDLDGNPRIVGGTADIGAYEFQSPASVLSYAWAQQNGFPTDGSADFTDADSDGMNNYGEWRSDTIPTNSLSVLRMINATSSPTGAHVTWQSVSTRSYWLERATNLASSSPFQTVATNIFGASGSKTFTDTSATSGGPYFYRVGVQ